MTDDRVDVDVELVQRLIREQFPHWGALPITAITPGGWDNRTFRLGEHMTVRLPSAERYAVQVAKEQRWLPLFAPRLPVSIPTPLACGAPTDDYPWAWSVYGWIDGIDALQTRIVDADRFVDDLAAFLTSLHGIDASDGPGPGDHNFFRGGSLDVYDLEARAAITDLCDLIDADAASDTWATACSSTTWQHPPVWVHGDLAPGNLLMSADRLCAVIDFGSTAVGDPACDLAIAWTHFDATQRARWRDQLDLDEPTWQRGRGWALWKAAITAAASRRDGGPASRAALDVIETVVADHLLH